MSTRRIILLSLLVLPLGAGIAALVWPGLGAQLAFLVLGVPVLALNAWEFFMPGGLGPEQARDHASFGNETIQKGSFMKKSNWWVWAIAVVVLIGLGLGFLGLRAYYTDVPFSWEIYHVSFVLVYKAWTLVTMPPVLIAILVLFLIWLLRKQIFGLRRGGSTQPGDSVMSDAFSMPCVEPATAGLFRRKKVSPWTGEWLDLKTVQLLLEIDGVDVSKPYLFSKVRALELMSEELPQGADPARRDAYFRGVFSGLCEYVLPALCEVETWDQDKVARFTLRDGTREKLLSRLHDAREAMQPPQPEPEKIVPEVVPETKAE